MPEPRSPEPRDDGQQVPAIAELPPEPAEAGPGNAEEYRGPATLRVGDDGIPVRVRLSAHFEPVEGRFRWAGRTGPDDSLRERVTAGLREAVISIAGLPDRPVRLGEPDPWGGVRLTGTGPPPWFHG